VSSWGRCTGRQMRGRPDFWPWVCGVPAEWVERRRAADPGAARCFYLAWRRIRSSVRIQTRTGGSPMTFRPPSGSPRAGDRLLALAGRNTLSRRTWTIAAQRRVGAGPAAAGFGRVLATKPVGVSRGDSAGGRGALKAPPTWVPTFCRDQKDPRVTAFCGRGDSRTVG